MQWLELILILLAAVAGLELVARRFSIPLPALLVVGGLLLAVTPGLPRVELNPDIIFLIFVPPLLYWAALTTSLRDFRRNLDPIIRLGVGLVLVTLCTVAWAAHTFIPGLTWGAAFVLGAIVSPPDAVAVTAVVRELGLPRTVITILEGESLVNDATAFVAYRMAVAAVVAGTFSIWGAGLRFFWASAGGIALGLLIGWLIDRLRRRIGERPMVENTLSLLTPYIAFIPAERLGLSSVLSVVAVGLYLGRRAPRIVSARTRLQALGMWEMISFLLEGLVFIIIGLELPIVRRAIAGYPWPLLIRLTVLLSATLILIRMLWEFAGAYLPRYIERRALGKRVHYPPWREVLLIGWAGIRGADSLVIALALPLATRSGDPFPGRNLIIFLTFAVILVTLVVQGLTLRPLIRLLSLRPEKESAAEELRARLKSATAGLRRLDEMAGQPGAPSQVVEELQTRYEHRLHRLSDRQADHTVLDKRNAEAYRRLRPAMIGAEREEAIRLRDRGEISDEALRRIQHDLDLEEMLLTDSERRAGRGSKAS